MRTQLLRALSTELYAGVLTLCLITVESVAFAQTAPYVQLGAIASTSGSANRNANAVTLTEKAKQHPDFGTVFLPDSTGKDQLDFVELTDQRTEYSATFHNFSTNTSCIRQSGDVPLHFKDESGLWRNVEEKFLPAETIGVYEMPKLKFPIGFDSRDGSSTIFFRTSGDVVSLGGNIGLIQKTFGGELLSKHHADPAGAEIGERDVVLKDFLPHTDFTGTFGLEGVKTSYVIRDKVLVDEAGDIVVFEEEITLPNGWNIDFNPENGQMTDLGWQGELMITGLSGKVEAGIMPASVWDSAEHDADYVRDEHSTIGAFTLVPLADNRFKLQLAVPSAWLRNPAVKFPVTVDPVVVVDNYVILGTSARFVWCSYALTANLPGTVNVTNTRNYWTIQAWNGAWRNEQRTRVVGPSATTLVYQGCCNSGGNQVYDLTSNIGNGTFTNSTTYNYEAYNTWLNYGCGTNIQYFSRRYAEVYYCSAIDDGSITANGSTGTINICLGSSVTIASVGGNTGSWCYWISSNGGASWNIEAQSRCNQGSFVYTPAAAGTYRFHKRHSDECGYCWNAGRICTCVNCVVDVVVQSNPTAPTGITGVATICSGSTTTLTASGGGVGSGASYQWGTGATVGSNIIPGATGVSYTTPALTSTTTYWVRRVGNTSCTATTGGVTQQVIVNPLSIAPSSITASATTLCGGTTTLTAEGGMIAYYPFTSDLNDASGNGLHLSGSGGSFAGGGINLTTASSYASAATAALNTDRYTISFDMMFTANPDGSWRKIFGFNSGGSDRSPGIWKFPGTMQLHWRHDPGNTGISEAQIYNLNQWYNVVGEKNGTTFTLYVNGVQVAQGNVANPKSAGLAALWFGGAPVRLREFRIYNGNLRWFSGSCGGTAVGNGPQVTVTPPLGTTNYFVRVEGICNTTGCATIGVTRVAPPTANAGGNISQCGTSAYTVTGATAGGTYSGVSWATSGLTGTGSITAGGNTLTPTFTPTSPTGSVTLTMTVTGSGACAGSNPTSSMTFSWISAPSADAGPATVNQCGTADVMFTGASASTPGSWSWTLLGGGSGTGTLINGGGSITAWGFSPTSPSGSRTVRLSNTGSGGCGTTTVTDDIVISWAQTPAISVSSPQNSCAGAAPVVITGLTPSGAFGGLSWALTPSDGNGSITANGSTATPTFTPTTAAGQYTLTLTATGNSFCIGVNPASSMVLNWAPQPTITSVGSNVTTCGTAPHAMTGATVSGTVGSVAWSGGGGLGTWSNTSSTDPSQWTFTPSSSTAGSFTATLTAFGSGTCAGNNAVVSTRVVSWSTPPTVNAGAALYSCVGSSEISMTGATAANISSYSWSLGTPPGTWNQGASISAAQYTTNTASGSLTVQVDVSGTGGCAFATAQSSRLLTWTTPPVIASVGVTNITDCNAPNGFIEISASGDEPLVYSIDNGATYPYPSGYVAGLGAGAYDVVVKDANDCVTPFVGNSVSISLPVSVSASSVVVTQNVTCGGGNDGIITINGISGGAAPYEYTLSGPSSNRWEGIPSPPNHVINELPAGTYDVVVRDRFGCMSSTYSVTVTQPTPISITSINVTDIVGCGGVGAGAIAVTASGGTGGLSYYLNDNLDNVAPFGSWGSLTAGRYAIEVQDAIGCSQLAEARVSAAWVPDAGIDFQICNGQSVQLQGGIIGQFPSTCLQVCTSNCGMPAGYCGAAATNTNDDWISAVQFAGIAQASGSSTYTDYTGVGSAALVYRGSSYPLNVQVSKCCSNTTWNQCVRAYFDWDRNGTFETAIDVGCSTANPSSQTINVTVPAWATLGTTRMRVIELYNGYANADGCGTYTYAEVEDYSVTVQGEGPCTPTVTWSNGLGSSFTPTVSPSSTTNYTLTINDNAGCIQSASVEVRVSNLTGAPLQTDVSCNAADNGCILIDPSGGGGIGPYLEKLSTGEFMVLGGRRREISIASAAALTNHQVTVNIPHVAPMRSDFGDIRFFDDNLNPIPYWVESYTLNGTAKVWLRVPALAAGTTTIHLVYGNSSLSTRSNGDAVFEFFDDFDSFDPAKWTQGVIAATGGTDWSHLGGRLFGGNTNRTLTSVPVFSGNYISEGRVFETAGAPNGFTSLGFHGTTANVLSILSHSGTTFCRNDVNWPNFGLYTSVNQWTRDYIRAIGANSFVSRTGETSGAVSATYNNSGISNERVRLGARGDDAATDQNYGAQWDWLFVRKYTATEPTATVGPVEAFNEAFCDLAPGNYSITMVDMGGCTDSENFTITEPDVLVITSIDVTNTWCYNNAQGALDITVTGGTPNYVYNWAGPSGFSSSSADNTGLAAGIYNVTVADDNACTASSSATVGTATPLNNGFYTWTGSAGATTVAWDEVGNWDCGLPDATSRVIIPAVPIGGATFLPVIGNGITGRCLDIDIQTTGTPLLELQDGGILQIGP